MRIIYAAIVIFSLLAMAHAQQREQPSERSVARLEVDPDARDLVLDRTMKLAQSAWQRCIATYNCTPALQFCASQCQSDTPERNARCVVKCREQEAACNKSAQGNCKSYEGK
jgi:hypothetical protein